MRRLTFSVSIKDIYIGILINIAITNYRVAALLKNADITKLLKLIKG